MMKKIFGLTAALVVFAATSLASRADQFTDIQKCPNTYWVPANPKYVTAPPPPYGYYGYYGAPPPYYYVPPPVPPPPPAPSFFIGFHFH